MNVKHKADIEHSLAMIEVMNRIKLCIRPWTSCEDHRNQDNISLYKADDQHQPPGAEETDRVDGSLYMSSMTEMTLYLKAIMSGPSIESTT
jgi:hypothetical protein